MRTIVGGERSRQTGQSLVELALIAPVVLLILVIAVDFGRVFLGWVTVTNVARIGANYAAVNPQGFQDNDAGVVAAYHNLMLGDANGTDCALENPLPNPNFSGYDLGDDVSVNVSCDFLLLTPLLGGLMPHPPDKPAGTLEIGATAVFSVRSGSVDNTPVNPPRITPPPLETALPSAEPSPTPTAGPTPTPTPTPDPNATLDPNATPTPTADATPTPLPAVNVSFYGSPAPSQDAYGGGPPGSTNENQIVGAVGVNIEFLNTTTGNQVICNWDFGDGATQNNCASSLSKIYTTRGVYNVTLTVNGSALTRSSYVLVSCRVPDFVSGTGSQQVHFNEAQTIWEDAGFTGPISEAPGSSGNFVVKFQSIVGGTLNPTGGCGSGIVLGK